MPSISTPPTEQNQNFREQHTTRLPLYHKKNKILPTITNVKGCIYENHLPACTLSSSSEWEKVLKLNELSDRNENTFVECQELYYHIKKGGDWIQHVQWKGKGKECVVQNE